MNGHETPALWEESLERPGNKPFASEESQRETLGLGSGTHLKNYYLADDTASDDPTGLLADKIVALARSWAGDDPEQLERAAQILARTPYLEEGKTP